MKTKLALFLIISGVGGGCSSEDVSPVLGDFLVKDSAGIRVSFSSDSLWTSSTRWQVSPIPTTVIGILQGDNLDTIFERIGRIGVLSDGRIAVADSRANEIRIFGPGGDFLLTMGGPGQGPAEFGRIDRISVIHGDSVVGRDVAAYKTVVFSADGEGFRSVSGPPISWGNLLAVYVAGWLRDGSAIVTHTVQPSMYPDTVGVVKAEWHLFDPEGSHRGLVDRLPDGVGRSFGENGSAAVFSGSDYIAPSSTGFWFGFSDKLELLHFGPDGLDRITRTGFEPPAVTETIRRSYKEFYSEDIRNRFKNAPQDLRDYGESLIDNMEFSSTLPAFRNLLISREGHLWLQNYETVEELARPDWDFSKRADPQRWTVLNPEGEWLGTVEMPAGVALRAIERDRVVGVLTDDLDVQYVVIHTLEKGNRFP